MTRFLAYTAASAFALAVDYIAYILLAFGANLHLPVAAALAYTIGLIVAYLLIAQKVMSGGWLANQRWVESLLFATSGLLGMAITYASVTAYVKCIGPHPHWAKLLAVGISFFTVYLFRSRVVFRKSQRAR